MIFVFVAKNIYQYFQSTLSLLEVGWKIMHIRFGPKALTWNVYIFFFFIIKTIAIGTKYLLVIFTGVSGNSAELLFRSLTTYSSSTVVLRLHTYDIFFY